MEIERAAIEIRSVEDGKKSLRKSLFRMIIFNPQGRKPQMSLTEMPYNDGGLVVAGSLPLTQIKNSGLCEILDYLVPGAGIEPARPFLATGF